MNLRSLFLACALLMFVSAPKLVSAQTIPITFTDDLQTARGLSPNGLTSTIELSLSDCQSKPPLSVAFTWIQAPTTGATETEDLFFARTNQCLDGTMDGAQFLKGTTQGQARNIGGTGAESYPITMGLTVQDVFNYGATALNATPVTGTPTCSNSIDTAVFLCVKINESNTTINSTPIFGVVQFHLFTKPPTTPAMVTASPLSGALTVNWTIPTSSTLPPHYIVTATDTTNAANVFKSQLLSSSSQTPSAQISGLTNNVSYSVVVQSVDDAGINLNNSDSNRSDPSTAVVATPQSVIGFFQTYAADGGQEQGGCATGGGTWLALLAALCLTRRKRRVVRTLLGLTLLSASTARAADPSLEIQTVTQATRESSPRHYTIQLDLGPYGVNVDSESSLHGQTPYAQFFGTRKPLLTRIEADVDFFDKFGRASIGVAFGFWQAIGKARTKTGDVSLDTELLNLYPLSLLLIYRADFLYERFGIPLVPYAKLGYGVVKYSDLTDGNTTTFTTPSGKVINSGGWARGIQYAVGVQFILDAIDTARAASLDQDFGINSTSIFFELGQTHWQGANGGLNLGGNTISGGFLVAF
jgi:hypothetical protein